jgi:hypothetical protein
MSRSNTLIYENYVACLNLFTKVTAAAGKSPNQPPLEDVVEELDRYKLWAGNTGAANTGNNWEISLDYRLQEAEFLKNQVIRLLESLSRSVGYSFLLPWLLRLTPYPSPKLARCELSK